MITDKPTKWNNYYEEYRHHLPRNPASILEIGTWEGFGLRWLRHAYPYARLDGIDIHITHKALAIAKEIGDCQLARVDQANIPDSYIERHGPWDVIIDDGSHQPRHQAASFRKLYRYARAAYVIEDLHVGQKWFWRLYSRFFGIRPMLMRLIDQQSKWEGPETASLREPSRIIFSPQLVIIIKGKVEMHVA